MDHWDRKHLWSHLSRCRRQSYLIKNVDFPMSFEWVRRMGDKKNVSYQFIMAHFSFSRYFGYIIYFSRIEIRIGLVSKRRFLSSWKITSTRADRRLTFSATRSRYLADHFLFVRRLFGSDSIGWQYSFCCRQLVELVSSQVYITLSYTFFLHFKYTWKSK